MYVILTTKPDEFHTVMEDGVTSVESYDYIFYGRKRANFTIAQIDGAERITIVEDTPPNIVNKVPSKLFESFGTLEEARAELDTLTHYGSMDIELRLV
ncbi:hypothetical protein [Celeribacter indicus]|uniref:Uncharacterized protein n=1 Tax=Celeribacter indicus TaxID=1208324 RepID=A0A0B5DTW0_9RHOB|nr:hypothetical protein [Celeribacter indicus]AJE46883.1 hypothetical protein P73_2168 [Celeribacter indicus]SDW79523.1 hypothetical protein SAMN05443573_10792 [Celeribacter indicus]